MIKLKAAQQGGIEAKLAITKPGKRREPERHWKREIQTPTPDRNIYFKTPAIRSLILLRESTNVLLLT